MEAISSMLQTALATAVKSISREKTREYHNPETGEITIRKERYLNVQVDEKLALRVDKVLKVVKAQVAKNPGNQAYIHITHNGIPMNAIAVFSPNEKSDSWSVSFSKAFVPATFGAEDAERFDEAFDKAFGGDAQIMRVNPSELKAETQTESDDMGF